MMNEQVKKVGDYTVVLQVENGIKQMNVFAPDGIKLPRLRYNTKQAQVFCNNLLIFKDLKKAFGFLERLIQIENKLEDNIVAQSLWFSFLVTYGKCFASASGGRGVKLQADEKGVLKGATPGQIALHNELINLRNTYVAHGGDNESELAHYYLALDPKPENKRIMAHLPVNGDSVHWTTDRLQEVAKLVNHIGDQFHPKMIRLRSLVEDELKQVPVDILYSKTEENQSLFAEEDLTILKSKTEL